MRPSLLRCAFAWTLSFGLICARIARGLEMVHFFADGDANFWSVFVLIVALPPIIVFAASTLLGVSQLGEGSKNA